MCFGVVGDLVELVDDVLRCGLIGIAHPQIDDVDALPPELHLPRVDLAEDVGRQAFDAS